MNPLLPLLAGALLATASAQTATPLPGASAAARPRSAPPAKPAAGKAVLPDPDLLDGSKYEAEKRPLYGMLSEIEMGEQENDQADRVGPSLPLPGLPGLPGLPTGGGAGGLALPQLLPPPASGEGGSSSPIPQGPQGEAAGAQAKSLQVPEGAQNPADGPQGGAREMQIGDATLQIQTVPQTPDMVGTEPSKAQQYEKPVPPGQQSNNRNQGVEKGKVIPKGL
jgi:hypothetical protein